MWRLLLRTPLAKGMIAGVIASGVWMGAALSWLDTSFLKSVVLACASSVATGCFGVYIARLQLRASEGLHDRLDRVESHQSDVAKALGLNRRPGDPGGPDEQDAGPQHAISRDPDRAPDRRRPEGARRSSPPRTGHPDV